MNRIQSLIRRLEFRCVQAIHTHFGDKYQEIKLQRFGGIPRDASITAGKAEAGRGFDPEQPKSLTFTAGGSASSVRRTSLDMKLSEEDMLPTLMGLNLLGFHYVCLFRLWQVL